MITKVYESEKLRSTITSNYFQNLSYSEFGTKGKMTGFASIFTESLRNCKIYWVKKNFI